MTTDITDMGVGGVLVRRPILRANPLFRRDQSRILLEAVGSLVDQRIWTPLSAVPGMVALLHAHDARMGYRTCACFGYRLAPRWGVEILGKPEKGKLKAVKMILQGFWRWCRRAATLENTQKRAVVLSNVAAGVFWLFLLVNSELQVRANKVFDETNDWGFSQVCLSRRGAQSSIINMIGGRFLPCSWRRHHCGLSTTRCTSTGKPTQKNYHDCARRGPWKR